MSRKKTGREGLLVWLQSRTTGYNNVKVVNFTDSWTDGLAFCALLHSFCPELVKYHELKPTARKENLEFAFSLADKLGIPRLIEPTDMLVEAGPNKFFVITYLAQFVDHFKRQENKTEPAPAPAPLSFLKQEQNDFKRANMVKEAEQKLRVRSNMMKSRSSKTVDRTNLVKGGVVAGRIREFKQFASGTRQSPPVEIRRGGTVIERVAELNRRTGSQTTHVAGDPYISERNVPTGLVAERIATFLKVQKQVQLDIEFIMVTSPRMRRSKRTPSQLQTPPKQFMSNIYYVMRKGETTPKTQTKNLTPVRHPTVQPLAL